MPSAHISRRLSIAWGEEAPTEPTSTLVLTTPRGTYIDIRLFAPLDPRVSTSRDIRPNAEGLPKQGRPKPAADFNQSTEWAFAGTSYVTPAPDKGPDVTHCVWEHWVDSKKPLTDTSTFANRDIVDAATNAETDTAKFHEKEAGDAEKSVLKDEGDMYPTSNPAVTREVGKMVRPETGVVTPYEEVWEDVEIRAIQGWKSSVVATLDVPDKGTKGMIVRVGVWCQGIKMKGSECTVERWEYVVGDRWPGEDHPRGRWKLIARAGNAIMPTAIVRDDVDLWVEEDNTYEPQIGERWVITEIDDCKV